MERWRSFLSLKLDRRIKTIEEEGIIELIKNGNESAFEMLFKKYLPIVLNQRNRYYLKGYEFDDWLQEGRLVCYQSVQKYDNSRNVTFGLFFKINFERHIISLIRYQQAKKRQTYLQTISIDDPTDNMTTQYEEDAYAKTSLEYVFVREALEEFPSSLSKFEIQIFYYVLKGKKFEEISERLDKPVSMVKSGYNRIKKKIKNEID